MVSATLGPAYCAGEASYHLGVRTRRAPLGEGAEPEEPRWHPPRPGPPRPVRPELRARRLRRRLRRAPGRARDARGRSRARCWRSSTSSTAAPRGPTPTPATAPGILIQIPDAFLRAEVDFELPEAGRYGVAVCFLPSDGTARGDAERLIERDRRGRGPAPARLARRAGRPRPPAASAPRAVAPRIRQLFVGAGDDVDDQDALRAQALRDPPRSSSATTLATSRSPSFSSARSSTRGCSPRRSCALLPRPAATSAS